MLILFPSLLVYCKHLMYGKNELVKNDGGSVNVYHPICEAGVQPVLKLMENQRRGASQRPP